MIIEQNKAQPEKWSAIQVAQELGVDERSVERYLADAKLREVLGAIKEKGRWKFRVPASRVVLEPIIQIVSFGQASTFQTVYNPVNERAAYFQHIREALSSSGRRPPGSLFKQSVLRESGFGNPQRERELKVLKLALDVQRLRLKK